MGSVLKGYKKPVNFYKNGMHLYNACKKLLGYECDDEVLKKICLDLYKEDINNYMTENLANGNGVCTFFYFEARDTLDKIKSKEISLQDVLKNTFDKFNNYKAYSELKIKKELSEGRNAETSEELNYLMYKAGVYLLYSEEGNLGYVGRSYNLSNRIPSSLKERGLHYFKYAVTKSKSDANIYEAYYIAKYKPFLNGDMVTDDECTIELPELEFSNKLFYYEY